MTIETIPQTAGNGGAELLEDVKASLAQALQLGDRVDGFTLQTRLLGDLPELDSMAVLTVIMGLEESFGFVVEDDEISAETFETVGNLVAFVQTKQGQAE